MLMFEKCGEQHVEVLRIFSPTSLESSNKDLNEMQEKIAVLYFVNLHIGYVESVKFDMHSTAVCGWNPHKIKTDISEFYFVPVTTRINFPMFRSIKAN